MLRYILIAGNAGTGKTTLARDIQSRIGDSARIYGLADPIKYMASALVGTPPCTDPVKHIDSKKHKILTWTQNARTVREMLQTLGTEWGQDFGGREMWCNYLVTRAALDFMYDKFLVAIIHDVRFQHEFEFFRRLDSDCTLIYTTNYWDHNCGNTGDDHASEQLDWVCHVARKTIKKYFIFAPEHRQDVLEKVELDYAS